MIHHIIILTYHIQTNWSEYHGFYDWSYSNQFIISKQIPRAVWSASPQDHQLDVYIQWLPVTALMVVWTLEIVVWQRVFWEVPCGFYVAGKVPMNGGFNAKFIYKWWVFCCYVWLPEGMFKISASIFREWWPAPRPRNKDLLGGDTMAQIAR